MIVFNGIGILCFLCWLWCTSVDADISNINPSANPSTNSSKFIYSGWDATPETEVATRNLTDDSVTELNCNFSAPKLYTVDYSKFSDEFLECPQTIIYPGCYDQYENGTVHVPLYPRVFNELEYIIKEDGELSICPDFFDDFTDDSKFSQTLDTFSIVGVAISTICIVLHIVMFLSLQKLRNLPGYCLFSLCIALLMAYVCSFIPLGLPKFSDCSYIGMIMMYSFLASFFWMNAISYDVWHSLRMATAKLRLTRHKPMFLRFALYSAYSWGGPLCIIFISLIVNSTKSDYRYNLIFNTNTCWFHYKQALLVYFATPIFILLFLNVILFISSFVMISSATMNTAENKAVLWSRFLVSIRLAIIMGLMWICGIIAMAAQITVIWYIYIILNTSQGVFIFFSFSFTKKSMKECKRIIVKKKSSLFPTQTFTSRGPTSLVHHESTL